MKQIPETRSVGGLVLNTAGDVLFVEEFGRYWGLPRGHVEGNEDDLAAITREIHEETGIKDLTYVCKLGSYSRSTFDKKGKANFKEIKHLSYYCFKTLEMELSPLDKDITDIAWLTIDTAKSRLINQEDIDFFNKSINTLIELDLIQPPQSSCSA